MAGGPLAGNALVLAAAKASVSGERLPDLVDRVQRHLGDRRADYGRRYECAHEDDTEAVFFVEEGHWADLGAELGLDEREWTGVKRAHEEHLKRLGTDLERRGEFDTALELREVVVIGKGTS